MLRARLPGGLASPRQRTGAQAGPGAVSASPLFLFTYPYASEVLHVEGLRGSR